jgi:hypothetical protein
MSATRIAKPIIKLFLLPSWDQNQFRACFNRLVKAAQSVTALGVNSENDLIILFSQDAMVYGAGNVILIEVDLPRNLITDDNVETNTANAIHAVMQGQLPDAYIQCNVYQFDTERGYRATGM